MATREEVYAAIDTERDYQDNLERNQVRDQRPLEQLSLIRHIINQIDEEFYTVPGQPGMDKVRKIAGIAVRMLEEHGAPCRGE